MRWRRLPARGLLLGALLAPGVARGDADEASIELHCLGGAARLGDPLADATETAPLYGGGFRFTYATSDYFAYDAALDLGTSGSARYPDVEQGGDAGDLERGTRVGRLALGVTARLGVRFVPTLQLAVGGQLRQFPTGYLVDSDGQAVASVATSSRVDLVVRGGAGFDYRVDRHWVAGITASLTHAVWGPAWDAVEGGLHLSYYWYPRWF